jgi:Pregnancy-associated plasma protein-A
MMVKKPARKTSAAKAKTAPPIRRKCAAMETHYNLLENNPGYRQVLGRLEARTASRMRLAPDAPPKPITIQTVVHVVYRSADQKLSAAQINSQIDVLNADFNARNADLAHVPAVWRNNVGNPQISFALAKKSPTGKATKGIVYKKTTKSTFSQNDDVKFNARGGSNAWPSDRYLNLWVCALGDGLLGYAQFPGGPSNTDGVVILNTAFGTTGTAAAPFNLGRTATHEVGHWLNLRHIWGDTEDCSGSDLVDDTPGQQFPNRGEPSFPTVTCNNGPNGDMFMNYMDYVDDKAMFLFTKGQVVRMREAIDALRPNIGTA